MAHTFEGLKVIGKIARTSDFMKLVEKCDAQTLAAFKRLMTFIGTDEYKTMRQIRNAITSHYLADPIAEAIDRQVGTNRFDVNIADAQYRQKVTFVLQQTLTQYWELVFAIESYETKKNMYLKAIEDTKPGVRYLIIHCGYNNEELQAITTSSVIRDNDRRVFTDPSFIEAVKKSGVEVVSWKQVRGK